MSELPEALRDVIDALGVLPGVGSRTAERYAYFLLKSDPGSAHRLADKLSTLHDKIGYCEKTFALVPKGQKYSRLYTSPERDKSLVAVVAEPLDIIAIEKIGNYHGTYHVLGGLISPIDNIGPEQLRLAELIKRIDDDNVEEIILATSASVEGESTALYIQKQLKDKNVRLSRLARGLPVGVDLEYADHITLGRALEGRTAL
jgi:recombination protein RecR